MIKEEVYKLIEYNGVYDDKVKRNLKKLIKKYHPDKNKGDSKIIKVIYEVKKELETNKVSYNPKTQEKEIKEEITKEEKNTYQSNLIDIQNEKIKVELKIKDSYPVLSNYLDKYSKIYREYFENKALLCETEDEITKYKKIKNYELVTYIAFIIVICCAFLTNNYSFIYVSFLFLLIILFFAYKRSSKIKKIKHDLNYYIEKDNNYNREIKLISTRIDEINNEIRDLEQKINKLDNDMRFYNNRLQKDK